MEIAAGLIEGGVPKSHHGRFDRENSRPIGAETSVKHLPIWLKLFTQPHTGGRVPKQGRRI